MSRTRLSRRTFLTAAGGVAVGLPVLECMLNTHGTAFAQSAAPLPKRYGLVFCGQSLGGDGLPETQSKVNGTTINEPGHFIAPATTGAGYALTTPLLPLAALQGDVTVISGMRIPYAAPGSGGAVPAAGCYNGFHGGVVSPLVSGMRSTSSSYTAHGKTSDQYIADLFAGQTSQRALTFRAQPDFYLDGFDFAGRQYVSYTGDGQAVSSVTSLQVAFNSVFGNFTPPKSADAAAQAQFDFKQRSRKSVLDLITGKRQALLASVGKADQQRLGQHFDEIRALEMRIQTAPPAATMACVPPASVPPDPAIGAPNADTSGLSTNTGYSDEDLRAQVLTDIIHMAFVCDIARVATLQITAFQSHMNAGPIASMLGYSPFSADLHEIGHGGDPQNNGQIPVSALIGWHVGHYARLLQKLKDTKEGAGTALDNSAIVFVPEGGHGASVEDAGKTNQTHSVENMAMIVGGRAGGMQPGKHIASAGAHPASVLFAAMKAVGYAGASFGEVTAPFVGL
jgi:hypothetical protein